MPETLKKNGLFSALQLNFLFCLQEIELRKALVLFIGVRLVLPLLIPALAGCAGKPWTTPVTDLETITVTQTFEEMQERDASCYCCVDAKASLFWDGPGEDRTVSGFLQLMPPSSVKFVVTNPLGQPLYAMVTDGVEFQSVNTTLKQSVTGEISTLMMQYDIPQSLLSANWGYWLMGRLHEQGATIDAIRQDESGRGVWITMRYPGEGALAESHLLIEPAGKRLLTRVLVDQEGKTIAAIAYEHGAAQDDCIPAGKITITDLPYGSKLNIELTGILTDRVFTPANFRLKVPANYEVLVAGERGRVLMGREEESED
jgi:hypothetical protein